MSTMPTNPANSADPYLMLRSNDPAQRRQAITLLGRNGDPDALPYLAEIYRNDPLPDLRDLAYKAGQQIRRASAPASASASAPISQSPPSGNSPVSLITGSNAGGQERRRLRSLADASAGSSAEAAISLGAMALPADDEAAPRRIPVRGRTYNVPREEKERARAALDAALSLNMRGDNAKALKQLVQALSLDPNLINDGFFNSLAATVTGLEGDGAVQMIVDGGQRQQFVRSAQKEKRQARVSEQMSKAQESNWGSVTFELLLYLLITTLGPILLVLVTIESARRFSTNLTPDSVAMVEATASLTPFFSLGAGFYVLMAAFILLGTLVSLFVQTGIIHVVSRFILRGNGTYAHLLTLLLRMYNRWLPIIFILSVIFIAFTFLSGGSAVLICLALPIAGISLYTVFKSAGVIGEAYDFGAGMGCVALLIATVVLVVLNALVTSLLGNVLANTLGTQFLG